MNHAATDSDWKDGFLFLGNQLSLDFLNTRPEMNGAAVELLPDFAALLRWSQAAGLLSARESAELRRRWNGSARARQVVSAAHQLRESLRQAVIDWESGRALPGKIVTELNRLLAEHPQRTRLVIGQNQIQKEPWFKTDQPEALLAPMAESASELFAALDRNRIRQCGQCVLHFHDTSRKGTRRWCSMRLCGNRNKVAAYAARHRS